MKSGLKLPILGVVVAIAVTTAMDASGLSAFSALPLFPLAGLFWYLERLSRRSMGLVWGRWSHYGLAVLCPVAVLGLVGLISATSGAVDISQTDWEKAWLNFALVLSTIALQSSPRRALPRLAVRLARTQSETERILVWSSIAFSLAFVGGYASYRLRLAH